MKNKEQARTDKIDSVLIGDEDGYRTISPSNVALLRSWFKLSGGSAAQDIMLQRLDEAIAERQTLTDTDQRFFAHSYRAMQRCASACGPKGINIDVWNNCHIASMEDFRLADDPLLLYTPEALKADDLQQAPCHSRDYLEFLVRNESIVNAVCSLFADPAHIVSFPYLDRLYSRYRPEAHRNLEFSSSIEVLLSENGPLEIVQNMKIRRGAAWRMPELKKM